MNDVEKNQSTITETLFLLDNLQYCDLNMPYHGAVVHSNKSTRKNLKHTNLDIQLLDTIAVVLCTGRPGDAFVKNPDGSHYIGQVWPGYTASNTSLTYINTARIFGFRSSPTGSQKTL